MTIPSSKLHGDGDHDELFTTTTYLIAVPSPSSSLSGSSPPSLFAMQVLHMQDSFQVWVGMATEAMCQEWHMSRNKDAAQVQPPQSGERDTEDEELREALKAAGRDVPQSSTADTSGNKGANRIPAGSLATEWAVAMAPPAPASPAAPLVRGSSLFRTTADLSLPMAQRLARNLNLKQIFLSLDLPPEFVAGSSHAPSVTNASASPMLLLEKNILHTFRTEILRP